MRLKNILLVVNDIAASKTFYHDLFGLDVIADFGKNVMLTERLVLQEREVWEAAIGRTVTYGGHDGELYFEENQMDFFLEKLNAYVPLVEYAGSVEERDWGQRVIRIYDPDRHMIEIAETTESVVRHLRDSGMAPEQVAEKVRLPLDLIRKMTE